MIKKDMFIKKTFLSATLILFCLSSWAAPQSLVELSKKEKERRAKITQKKNAVTTNADLIKKKRTPALVTKPVIKKVETKTDSETKIEDEAAESEESKKENKDQIDAAAVILLEESWNKSEEYASLLALKIRALLQEFYETGDLRLKEDLQRQMNALSQQLEIANKDKEKAKEKYDLAKAALENKKPSLSKIDE